MPQSQKITTAVIAAAGQATRMWPASKVFPKELFPLGKIPVVVHIVWEFIEAGVEDVVIVAAAHNKGYVAALFDRSVSPPPKLANDPLVRRFQESLERCRLSIIEQSGSYGNGTPLLDAARQFPLRPRERVTFEYVLLNGVNDAPEHAREVARRVHDIRCKVNLIAFNPGPGVPYTMPTEERVLQFQSVLTSAGVLAFIRRPRGRDIYAACGQLKRTVA